MGQLNRLLTWVVTVMAGYLGTYSAYVEWSGLPWSLGYKPYDVRLCCLGPWTGRVGQGGAPRTNDLDPTCDTLADLDGVQFVDLGIYASWCANLCTNKSWQMISG